MTSLQEIKAMLDKYDADTRDAELKAIFGCLRSAFPVIESARKQRDLYASSKTAGGAQYLRAAYNTENQVGNFTESYPDERA